MTRKKGNCMETGISPEKGGDLSEIAAQTKQICMELLKTAHLEKEDILVVGCSSSEVAAHAIGSYSSAEIGETIFDTLYRITKAHDIYLAAQCCEHLNRALIIEKEAAKRYGFPIVNVVPQLKAGGSFASAAFRGMLHPVAIETVRAQAGIDIGDTLIGMHLVPVAVPVRTTLDRIGSAHVVCARTRPKYIGGERAVYEAETRGL